MSSSWRLRKPAKSSASRSRSRSFSLQRKDSWTSCRSTSHSFPRTAWMESLGRKRGTARARCWFSACSQTGEAGDFVADTLEAGIPETNLEQMQLLLSGGKPGTKVKDINVKVQPDYFSEDEGDIGARATEHWPECEGMVGVSFNEPPTTGPASSALALVAASWTRSLLEMWARRELGRVCSSLCCIRAPSTLDRGRLPASCLWREPHLSLRMRSMWHRRPRTARGPLRSCRNQSSPSFSEPMQTHAIQSSPCPFTLDPRRAESHLEDTDKYILKPRNLGKSQTASSSNEGVGEEKGEFGL